MDDERNGMAGMLSVSVVFEIAVVTSYYEGFGLGIERRKKMSQELIELVKETLGRPVDAFVSDFVGQEVFEEGEGVGPVNGGEMGSRLCFRATFDVELELFLPDGGREVCRHGLPIAKGIDVSKLHVGSGAAPRRHGLPTSGSGKVLRRKCIGEGSRDGVRREEPLNLMEEVVLVDHVVRGRVGIRPEVSSHPLCTVHAGKKRGLSGSALGKSLYAEDCVEVADEVMVSVIFGQMTSPALSVAEATEGLSLVLGEGI